MDVRSILGVVDALRYVAIAAVGLLAGCGILPALSSPAESQPSTYSGIIMLTPGERVQHGPANEEMAVAFDKAWRFAEQHANDTGYPWLDPATDELVLSAATDDGRELLEAEAIRLAVPSRIRQVTYSFAELQRIQNDASDLRLQGGVPGADLIYKTYPDHRDNRTVISIAEMNEALLNELASRFGGDALAVEVAPYPGWPPAS